MYTVEAVIEGVAPILFNGWTKQALEDLDTGRTGGKRTIAQKEAEGEAKLYRDARGIYLPKWNLKRCLEDGCRLGAFKEGRKGLLPYLQATVFIEEDPVFDGPPDQWFMHICWGRIPPRTGTAAILRRPALPAGWRLPFQLVVMDDNRDPGRLNEVVTTAGLLAGIGAWRPEYGRFLLTDWKVKREK